jgi:phosphate transport system permease protein
LKPDPAVIFRRRIVNKIMIVLFLFSVIVSIGTLAALLWKLIISGLQAFSLDIFLKGTPAPGTSGGLLNAIAGSVVLVVTALIVAIPFGLLAGTYLAEYGRTSRLGNVIRFCTDILLSAPSIIIGLFIYGIIVLPSKHFSAWAGAASLCLIAIPVIVRTTEDVLLLVPNALREATVALGCPYWKMVMKISWKSARPGIITGILLAIARISGETAPLLFTSLNNQFFTFSMNGPVSSLPVVIFQFAMSPYKDWQNLAWAGALLIAIVVLGLNIFARRMLNFTRFK